MKRSDLLVSCCLFHPPSGGCRVCLCFRQVRIDGVLYDEGTYGGELALANPGGVRHNVDPSAGRFSASGAVGLAGHVENFFLATYLRDFNRLVPLTTESSVTEGMLEVLSPAVSSRGLATANPIKQPESRRQAKLAVFWGVVAMGSRILGAADESTVRYLGLMRSALRECFDCNDKEVVQAYLLLSTVETMRGNEAAGKRYLDHAHTMHNGNAIGPEGKLLRDRSEQDVSLDLVFQMYDQPDGAVSGFNRSAAVGDWRRNQHAANGSSSSSPEQEHSGGGSATGKPTSAVDQMIAQAVSPPSECQSSPLKALKYLSTVCGLSSEVFDPTNKCVTVKQYLAEMDSALKVRGALLLLSDAMIMFCSPALLLALVIVDFVWCFYFCVLDLPSPESEHGDHSFFRMRTTTSCSRGSRDCCTV